METGRPSGLLRIYHRKTNTILTLVLFLLLPLPLPLSLSLSSFSSHTRQKLATAAVRQAGSIHIEPYT